MKIVTFGNLKGGTGKTTLVHNLGALLATRYHILLIDLDLQGNLSSRLGVDCTVSYRDQPNVCNIFLNERDDTRRRIVYPPEMLVRKNLIPNLPNLDIIPSNLQLANLSEQIIGRANRFQILSRYIERFREFFDAYDYILIDTSPSADSINENAFFAADEIVLVCDVSKDAMIGAENLIVNWNEVCDDCGIDSSIHALVINNFSKGTNSSNNLYNCLTTTEPFSSITCKTVIPSLQRFTDTITYSLPIHLLPAYKAEITKRFGRRYDDRGCKEAVNALNDLYAELVQKGVF